MKTEREQKGRLIGGSRNQGKNRSGSSIIAASLPREDLQVAGRLKSRRRGGLGSAGSSSDLGDGGSGGYTAGTRRKSGERRARRRLCMQLEVPDGGAHGGGLGGVVWAFGLEQREEEYVKKKWRRGEEKKKGSAPF